MCSTLKDTDQILFQEASEWLCSFDKYGWVFGLERITLLLEELGNPQQGLRVIRAHEGTVEAGEIRPVREGADLQGAEIVRLKEREGSPVLWDVDVQYDGRKSHPGPARVTSRAYRRNYESIFGPKSDPDMN